VVRPAAASGTDFAAVHRPAQARLESLAEQKRALQEEQAARVGGAGCGGCELVHCFSSGAAAEAAAARVALVWGVAQGPGACKL
jgi:mevalonate kinase